MSHFLFNIEVVALHVSISSLSPPGSPGWVSGCRRQKKHWDKRVALGAAALEGRVCGMLVSQLRGLALSSSIVTPFWSNYPSQEAEVPGGGQ